MSEDRSRLVILEAADEGEALSRRDCMTADVVAVPDGPNFYLLKNRHGAARVTVTPEELDAMLER